MRARHCNIPFKTAAPRSLQKRLKDFEALLRDMKPEEGYEWPEVEEREEVTVEDR